MTNSRLSRQCRNDDIDYSSLSMCCACSKVQHVLDQPNIVLIKLRRYTEAGPYETAAWIWAAKERSLLYGNSRGHELVLPIRRGSRG